MKHLFFLSLIIFSFIFASYSSAQNVLVIVNDSTAAAPLKRKADRDTLRKCLSSMIINLTWISKDSNTVFPNLNNYSGIIIQETSYDEPIVRGLSMSQRTALKTWLTTGTPSAKKSLVFISADAGYNYDRSDSPFRDTSFSRGLGGYIFITDDATTSIKGIVNILNPSQTDNMTAAPPEGGFYPDGCRTTNGSIGYNRYVNRTSVDSLAAIFKMSPGSYVITAFQDPRYFTGTGSPGSSIGFKRVLRNLLEYVNIITSVEPVGSEIPNKYNLSQNYPNPFNPVTQINFSIPKSGMVRLTVYNVMGMEVATLINEVKTAGNYAIEFDGSTLSSGTYLYRLEVNDFVETKKMLLIK